jgi:hypothetical protein
MTRELVATISCTLGILLLSGCQSAEREQTSTADEGTEHAAAQAEPEEHHHHEDCDEQGDCGEESPADQSSLSSPQAVGQEVDESIELVNAADILADPDAYEGRTVRIAGPVKAFCHHRRAWFAIDVPDGTPPYIRVITAPQFQVPPGIMNAQASAVGTVELGDVPGARMRHFEREHGLVHEGGRSPGRARQILIRATGATFEPAES